MSTKLEENWGLGGPSDFPICPLEGPKAGLRLGPPGSPPGTPASQLEPPARAARCFPPKALTHFFSFLVIEFNNL